MLSRFTIFVFLLPLLASSQKQVGMEQYYFHEPQSLGLIVPKINYQSPKNWYGELRYNWEELGTASVHVGKAFDFDFSSADITIIPLAGICFGQIQALSAGTIIEANVHRFSFFSEPQYVSSLNDRSTDFFYSWSEVAYQIKPFLYAGFALQQTKVADQPFLWEPGILGGVSIKNFDVPIYLFNPFSPGRNIVFGLNWKWQNNK